MRRQIKLLPRYSFEARRKVKAKQMTEGKGNFTLPVAINILPLNLQISAVVQNTGF